MDLGSNLGSSRMFLIEIGSLFNNHSRRHGWTLQGMKNARQFLGVWHIMMEESASLNSSPVEYLVGIIFSFFVFMLDGVFIMLFLV